MWILAIIGLVIGILIITSANRKKRINDIIEKEVSTIITSKKGIRK